MTGQATFLDDLFRPLLDIWARFKAWAPVIVPVYAVMAVALSWTGGTWPGVIVTTLVLALTVAAVIVRHRQHHPRDQMACDRSCTCASQRGSEPVTVLGDVVCWLCPDCLGDREDHRPREDVRLTMKFTGEPDRADLETPGIVGPARVRKLIRRREEVRARSIDLVESLPLRGDQYQITAREHATFQRQSELCGQYNREIERATLQIDCDHDDWTEMYSFDRPEPVEAFCDRCGMRSTNAAWRPHV